MPRDSSGNMTLPATNPVVADTDITTTWANGTMADLAAEIEDSLSRSGKGGMLVPFQNSDGTVSEPGVTFTNDTTTGLYRSGSGLAVSLGGVLQQLWATALTTFKRAVKMESTLEVGGNATFSGDVTVAGTVTESGRAGLQLSNSSGDFVHLGDTTATDITDGSSPITVSVTTQGRPVTVGLQAAGGVSGAFISLLADGGLGRTCKIIILRDGVAVAMYTHYAMAATNTSIVGVNFIDSPSAGGPYVYTAQVQLSSGLASVNVSRMRLYAYEM